MLLLENLCTGKLHANSVVIEDDTGAPCRSLVLVFLHHMCQRYDEVLLMAFERPPHFYLNALPAPLRQKVRVPVIPRPQRTGDRLAVGPLITAARQVIQGSGVKVGVVIDSVSDIIFTHSATAVPQLVQGLLDYRERGSKVEQVLRVFHPGVHDDAASRQVVCGHSDAWIRLRPSPSPRHRYSCLLRHGDVWHKPTVCAEEFNISANCLHVQDLVSSSKLDTVQVNPAEPQVDPAANLTFNLSLKPEEKAAREQVVLPYTLIASSDGGGSAIHYIPDDDDDFDDEDPDDDLDF